MRIARQQRGYSVIEIIIAASVVITLVVVVSGALRAAVTLARHTTDQTQGALLLDEASEALQLLRDMDWDTYLAPLTLDSTYYLSWDGSVYTLAATPVAVDGLYRVEVELSEVRRDGAGVLDSSGSIDSESRRATVAVYLDANNTMLATGQLLVHNSYAE